MVVLGKRPEVIRLQKGFEAEAATFPDLALSILYFSQEDIPTDRIFRKTKSSDYAVAVLRAARRF
jgi:hypothetical protein